MSELEIYKSVWDFKAKAKKLLPEDVFEYLEGGAEDRHTVERNILAYRHFQLRPRRLVDVTTIDTSVNILGEQWFNPFALAPVGLQKYFHSAGEIATAMAAAKSGHQMAVSTVSNASYAEVASHFTRKPWFQLYPTTNREVTKVLLKKAEESGCKVLILTVDVPVLGNRQKHRKHLVEATTKGMVRLGNLDGVKGNEAFNDPSLTWKFIDWIREYCNMKVVLKGIMTREDAELCLLHDVDGVIVSNHGGRQLESGLSTLECLEEVVQAVAKKIPVLLDGGIRRGTDILKALSLGANAVFIGRAFCYGLAVAGQAGVEAILKILREELLRDMQLLGVTKVSDLNKNFIRIPRF